MSGQACRGPASSRGCTAAGVCRVRRPPPAPAGTPGPKWFCVPWPRPRESTCAGNRVPPPTPAPAPVPARRAHTLHSHSASSLSAALTLAHGLAHRQKDR